MNGLARGQISSWASACLALGLSIELAACGGGGDSNGPLSVSVTSASSTVAAGASAQVKATVLNDSLNEGVTWTVSCSAAPCGSVSPTFTLSGAATTYTAPGPVNSSGFTVTITAAAVSNSAISGSVKVGISEPLWVSVSTPAQTTLPPDAGVRVTATVGNDPATKGVTWTVGCNVSPCGTVSPTTTQSGVATTYTAPPGLAPAQPVTITATSVSDPHQSAAASVQIGASIQINVLPSATVAGGASAQITATLLNYPLGGGLTWTVSCSAASCGSVSPTSSASGATVTYTAPMPPPPPGPLQVTVTVTSATSGSVQATTSIEVEALTVGVVPLSALLPLNVSQKFTATVGYDNANKGVTWALTQNGASCSPACGTVNPASTASGSPATYSAPAALPANRTVILTAASVTEASVSVAASVTLTNGSVSLVPADLTFKGCHTSYNCPVPPQVAVLTNTGPSALSISGITIGGTSAGDFAESNTCGQTVAAGASCNITVTYKSSSKGTHTAVLSIADNSPDTPQQLSLTGIDKATVGVALQTALRDRSMAVVPPPTGDSQVGTRLMHWVDDSRVDPYRADGTKRELMVRFWYPISGNAACTPADYTSAGVLSQFSQLLHTTLPQISTNSCLNAPVAAGTHPVVVVTPGFTGTFTDYTFLTEDLASRGYVVVAVDHTYEATAVEFPDGRVEQGVFGSYLTRYTRSDPRALEFAVSVRLADLRFVVNELTALNGAGDTAFAGKLDLARIALAGHSLGGLTTVRGVEKDARFRAGISLDGLVPDRLTPPTTTPVLLVRAGINPWNENDCQLWSALRGDRAAVNLTGAEHTALSDAVWLGSGAIATGHMGMEKTIAAIRETSAAFLNAAFTGASVDVPAFRSLLNDPDAIITMQGQSPCSGP